MDKLCAFPQCQELGFCLQGSKCSVRDSNNFQMSLKGNEGTKLFVDQLRKLSYSNLINHQSGLNMTTRRPTEVELELLQLLWDQGPSTVREIFNHLEGKRGYTTVLKHFQIMFDKGLVDREADGQSHRYRARASEKDTQRGIVRHLVDGAFRKSSHALVMHALDERQTTAEELIEIRSLIDKLESERNNES